MCGVHPSTCIHNFLYENSRPKYGEALNDILKPSIISRFPEFDNSIDSVDDEIISYCFPDGFHPIFSVANKIENKFFSVILDNNLFSAEYPQKYLSCLLFYENISAYSNLKSKIKEKGIKEILDLDDIEEVEEIQVNSEDTPTGDTPTGDEPKVEVTPTPNESQENGYENKLNEEDLNIAKKQFSSNITIDNNYFGMKKDEIKDKNLATSLNYEVVKGGQFLKRSSFISDKMNIFIPKCICLVSIHPYINTFHDILDKLLDYIFISKQKDIPIEKIITNLIIETPIPPRGLYTINYNLFNKQKQFIGCENNKVQVTEISLRNFNSSLNFQTKLEAIKHIILCSKILLFSKDLNKLSETILSFLILLFPFKYPFQVTSYLHKDNYNILESISPYFIGINESYSDLFFEQNEISIEGMSIFIIDLDKKKSYVLSDETFPNFPSKLLSTLEKDIKNLESKLKKENEQKKIDYNIQYQNLFFEFFCELLKGYEDCLNMDYFNLSDSEKSTSIDTLFQCSKYVKSHSGNESEFYKLFTEESQLFADFIYKRMIPRNNQEIIDVLLVNETNIKIKNKQKYFGSKENTEFLDSKEYEPSNIYAVPLPRELTDLETTVVLDKKDKLLGYGQLISISNNNNNKEIKIFFDYLMFPELDFHTYCNNDNVNDYMPPPDYTDEIEAINSDLLSKSSIGQNINLSIEMKDNLYLTWLEVWAYTFWYVDTCERKYRFNQMLDLLDKVIHHEMNIINLIFEVLNQQNEHLMLVKLYQKILQLKINPSTFIYKIVSDRLDSKEMKELLDEMKSGTNQKSLKFDKKEQKELERTFLCKNEKPSLINKKITFESEFSCVECPLTMNLYDICKTFEGIKNDILWVPCKNGHYNLPKIRVIFGLELFPKNDHSKVTTSEVIEVVLHSPNYLKTNIKNAVNTSYGINLKVDEFRTNFAPLFWNFVWYCQIHGLDYTILLPYLKNLEKYRAINAFNPNDGNINLKLDNVLFKKNEELISKAEDQNNIGQESGNLILVKKAHFKNLKKEKVISLEIQIIGKLKNKKTLTKFIDHSIKKAMSLCEIKEVPSISQTEIEVVNSTIRGSAIIPKGK